ncbi:MAG: hypothetical protein RI906_499 [Pseudomonadota bacterium]|jgi:hypothetical protein
MSSSTRNRVIWCLVIAVAIGLWALVARVRMHLVDELLFLGCVAIAAGVLAALYWWDVSADTETESPAHKPTNPFSPESST